MLFIFHFGATMEFSDCKSSPDPSRSDGSSEFVEETPGPDWEDDPSTLSDNEEGPPKPKKNTLMEYFMPTPCSTLPFGRIVPHSQPTSNASTRSTDDADQVQVLACQLKQDTQGNP